MDKGKVVLPYNSILCPKALQANIPGNQPTPKVTHLAGTSSTDANANLFMKLRTDWRNIKGELKGEKRPYHVAGQLLLLKPWSSDFDPFTEPYKNPEALIAILQANNFGTFLKLDPIHIKRKWVKFIRLCINTNVELTTGQKLIILDENMIEHNYNVWFDYFPVGCGNCGEIDHGGGWTRVQGETSQSSKHIHVNPHGHMPYLVDNGGISIIYESDSSFENGGEGIKGNVDLEPIPNSIPQDA
ncbi:hypothetical protein V2J09_017737 [Rumex salicifolius]